MQPQFSLKQLEYFLAAAELGTLRAAAERCHVSQGALGVALTELERTLDTQLFLRRRAKGVNLTPQGQAILPAVRAIVTQSSALQASTTADAKAVTGTLRIGCDPGFALMLMPDTCDTFAKQHPDLTVEFREGSHQALTRSIEEGQIEAAFLYERDLPDSLQWTTVIELHPYVIVPESHPLAERTSVHLHELQGEPLIRLTIPRKSQTTPDWGADDNGAAEVLTATTVELVRALVGRGLGYAVLGQRSQSTRSAEGRPIRSLAVLDEIPPVRIVLAYAGGTIPSPRVRALGEFTRAQHLTQRES